VTTARYLVGVVLVAIVIGPVAAAAWALRVRLLPCWSGPPARLVEIVVGCAGIVVLSEMLGAAGLYRLGAVMVAFPAAGAIAWWLATRAPRTARLTGDERSNPGLAPPVPSRLGPAAMYVAAAITAVVVASWSTGTIDALRHGVIGIDTLWYHLPIAARFIQTGSMTAVHYINSDPDTAFVPANSEMFHALGMILTGSDFLSAVLNVGWLAVALLAGWCIGRPYGVAPVTMAGVAVVVATPMLVSTQPGGAYADIVGLALLLAAVAVLVNAERAGGLTGGAVAVAALAAGLATGAKYTFLGFVAALSVAVVVAARPGERVRAALVWAGGLALTGSFWYARNLVRVGNPLPPLGLTLGPLSLPTAKNAAPAQTVAEFLSDGRAWRGNFLPGLRETLGPAWGAVVALALAGIVVAAIAGPGRLRRCLGGVGIVAIAAYLVTPQNIALFGAPVWFKFQVRWLSPALAIGLVLLPIAPAVIARSRAMVLLCVYAAIVAITQLDPAIWPTHLFTGAFAEPVRGAESALAVAVGLSVLMACIVWVRFQRIRSFSAARSPVVQILAVLVVVLGGGGWLHDQYIEGRFAARSPRSLTADLHHERIGFVGLDLQQYPWYGPDLSNYVQYVGAAGKHGAFRRIRTCFEWRRALNAGRYTYVIIAPSEVRGRVAPEQIWIDDDPRISLVRSSRFALGGSAGFGHVPISLYSINGKLDPAGCRLLSAAQQRLGPG
jgi:hypothetical protein